MSSDRGKAKGKPGPENPNGPVRADIAERVLAYFQRNSQAMDSVDGIARFWVREDRSVVERCLLDLHRRGLLDRRTIAGTDFYSLPEKRSPIPETRTGRPAAAPARTVAAPGGAETAPEARPDGSAEQGGRVLVVDDDASVRKFIEAALTEAGHSVAGAEDGEQALEIFRASPFELVVTDVKMPGMSGIQLLEEIKRDSPATEVIVVTAYATLDTAVKALRHGAYDLITKPLEDIEALFRVVTRALERRRLTADNRLLVQSLQARNVELKETVARLAAVNEIGKATTGLLDLDELYDSLVRLVAQHLKARRVSLLISEPESDTMALVASVGVSEEALRSQVRVGHGIAGGVAASQKPLLVEDIDKSSLREMRAGGRYATPSFMITPLMVSYPIRYQRRRVGVINVSDKHSGDPFTEQDLEFLATLASQVAVAIENARLVKEMEDGYFGVLVSMIQASEDAQPEARDHSMRVAALAADVARALGLPEPRVEILARAAAVHEVGRLAARPGRADRPDRGERAGRGERASRSEGETEAGGSWTSAAVMATERVLAPIVSLRDVREIILRSADWFDAAPRPLGAERSAAPIESRILAACEEFVRLTPGNGHDPERQRAAFERLRKLAGRRFDPEVVETLCGLAQRSTASTGGKA